MERDRDFIIVAVAASAKEFIDACIINQVAIFSSARDGDGNQRRAGYDRHPLA
ncbi:hypothetical protein GF325_06225 [Candidatus Bathyarchaeota archaeon]|nr:hypothetical protein [Candidatus Bathyarchaeota archaeon]